MTVDKIVSYLGFCIKSRQVVFGAEMLERTTRRIYAVFLCRTAGENTKKTAVKVAEKNKAALIVPQLQDLEEMVHKKNCKTAAVTHKDLATAIKQNINENYTVLGGDAL